MSDLLGIILAAGQSTRMGQPKALLSLPHAGRTFVTQLIATLHTAGLASVAVVSRPFDRELSHEIAAASPPVTTLENPSPELGQLSSLLVAVAFAESIRATGILVVPVDMPLIQPASIRAALDALAQWDEPIVRVTHRGRHGHPVIFRAAVFDHLKAADPALGARAVLRADRSRVRDVEVDDPGVLRDFDYPNEYRELIDRPPR